MTACTYRGSSGNALAGEARGDTAGRPVVLLHGGGQTRHAWEETAVALAAAGFFAIAIDLRGHGDSEWPAEGDYGLEAFAADVACVVRALPRPPALVGASLGGLSALLVAGSPGMPALSAVVLVNIAPRLEPEGVLRIVSFMRSRPDGFASLDDAADAIAEYLPGRPRPRDLSGLAKNLRLGADGRYRWHWDPRFLTGEKPPHAALLTERLVSAARSLTIPTLLVRGRQSDILSEDGVAEFRAAAPHAEYVDVAKAGHMVAGDRNDAFSAAVTEFLIRSST